MTPDNAALPAGYAVVPPAQHLYQSANPAMSSPEAFPGGLAGRRGLVAGRNSLGPICAEHETKCAQGDWCCNTGEACSFDTLNGAFLCCGSSAGNNGCARVCSVGTFQCGSVCCTFGQTCYGGDTVSGYCLQASQIPQTSLQTTTSRATATVQSLATGTRVVIVDAPSVTGSSYGASSSNLENTGGEGGGGGVSIGMQIGIGVAVPLVVLAIAAAAWFFIVRCRRARPQEVEKQQQSSSACSSHHSPSPSLPAAAAPAPAVFPPANLPRNAMIVSTPVEPFQFGQPRTPMTSLPPPVPETPSPADRRESSTTDGSASSSRFIATPRLATPIDLLSAVASKRKEGGSER